ncbi:MAG: hypothetical protein IJJ69_11145 [Oscillospiraceae bacterium]|nr:hypothetical protein [Oscillospiraceae bacterium]
MIKKNLLFGIVALLLLMLAGSAVSVLFRNMQNPAEDSVLENFPVSEEISDSASETEFSETDISLLLTDVPEFPTVPLSIPEIQHQDALLTVEAEHAQYTGALHPEEHPECSNGQCISGFSGQEDDSILASFMIPAEQHYNITVSVRAEVPGKNAVLLNGQEIGIFTLNDTEHFTRVTISGIYLPAGQADVAVQQKDGNIAVDYFEISNNTELEKIKYNYQYELSDPQASPNAEKLMCFLAKHYGKDIITGQYASGAENTELDFLCQITGKYPAIRFGDVQCYSNNTASEQKEIIRACERWAKQGGIVGLMWHWDAPSGISSVYAEETDFSLADAVPESTLTENAVSYQTDVALMSEEEIQTALENNQISEECVSILHDIDSISKALKPLSDKDIPVLWRPLHEAGGGWYWWSADGAQAYRWLWDVMYRRMTEYHQLHNLIWVWNGQSENWLVDKYDIASMDIYLEENQDFNSRYEEFVSLYRMTKHQKILALSECGSLPDVNRMFRDNTIWSFMGLWYDNYLFGTDSQTLIDFYNSEKVVTLDNVRKDFQ